VGQATAFMTAGKTSKTLTSLESYYNRNYDSVGGYGNERYMGAGTRGYNYNDGYNNRYNDYNRGGFGGNDSRYGGYGRYGQGMTRSRFSDWLNGSSNYIPTSADRNYVMDRGYETGNGRYNNYYYNGDRYNDRFNGGGYNRFTPYNNNRGMNEYNRGPYNNYNRGMNEYDRNYSPVGYNNNRYGSYNRDYDRNYDRSFRSNEYQRTYRSPMDSHRQDYPSYGMGGMEDQFGSRKWWDGN